MQFFKQDLSVRDLSNLRLFWGWKFTEQLVIATIILIGFNSIAWAQRRPIADETLGNERSIVTPDVINGRDGDRIDGGARRGENLFHSFREFSVDEGRSAYFSNPSGIRNILSRVTGNNISEILGTLGVLGDANLFFLNPNGIIFGPNARLDIRGSFLASTGDRFAFADGSEFSATNPQAPLLIVNITPGLQYGTGQRGNLSNAANLSVGAGQSLTLHGGTVTSTGILTAPGGRVEVLGDRVALLDNARIDVSSETGGGTVLIGGDYRGQGTVPNALRTFVAPGVTISADALSNGNGGRVIVWGEEATGFYGNISARGGSIAGNGGFVEVSGGEFLDFQGNVNTSAPNGIFGTLLLDPTNIDVVADGSNTTDTTLLFGDLPENAQIAASAINAAQSNVILEASNAINFNAPINIAAPNVGLTATANAQLTVDAPIRTNGGSLSLTSKGAGINSVAGELNTQPQEGNQVSNAGSVLLSAVNDITTGGILTETNGSGNGGSVTINSSNGSIDTSRGYIYTQISDYSSGSGNGGPIRLTAKGDIRIGNLDSETEQNSRPIGNLNSGAESGNGGSIELTSTEGSINTTGGTLYSDSQTGNAGTISISAVGNITTSTILAETSRNGNGGNIMLDSYNGSIHTATGFLSTQIRNNTDGTGNGGSISLIARGDVVTGSLDASANSGSGNDIEISTEGNIDTTGGTLFSESRGDRAGHITISGASVNLGNIIASAKNSGGNVDLTGTDGGVQVGYINTSVVTGNAGSVEINATGDIRISRSEQVTTDLIRDDFSELTGQRIPIAITTQTNGGGNGGNVTLTSTNGNIDTSIGGIYTQIRDPGGSITNRTGNGGNIAITARGNINTGPLNAGAEVGNGGFIRLESSEGDITSQGRLYSDSRGLVGGGISLRAASGSINVVGGIETSLLSSPSPLTDDIPMSGRAGDIDIYAPSITLHGGAQILATARGEGSPEELQGNRGGNIRISTNSLDVDGLITARVQGNSARGGNISLMPYQDGRSLNINIRSTNIISLIDALATEGAGRGGDISITAPDSITIIGGGGITVQTDGTGQAGDLSIATTHLNISGGGSSGRRFTTVAASTVGAKSGGTGGRIRLSPYGDGRSLMVNIANDGSNIAATTTGNGTGGSISIAASDSVTLVGGGLLTVETSGSGQAGQLSIETGQLNVRNGTQVLAGTNSNGQGGSISLRPYGEGRSLTVNLDSGSSISAGAQENSRGSGGGISITAPDSITLTGEGLITVQSNSGATGTAGTLDIQTDEQLNIRDGMRVSASASKASEAGDITITASEASLNRGSIIGTTELGTGGDIILNIANSLRLYNDSEISASTQSGRGGNVTIQDLDSLQVFNSLISTESGTGRAGKLTVNASDSILLGGTETISETQNQGGLSVRSINSGEAGTLTIDTDNLTIRNGASIAVGSTEQGNAGNLTINALDAFLNRGSIRGTTDAGIGGDITLNIANSLHLRNDSDISTSTQSGRGGDITIQNLDSLRVFNSLISAESETGRAGRLNVIASDSVSLRGTDNRGQGGLSVRSNGGVAGTLNVTTDELRVEDRASIEVGNAEQGNAGNLTINALDAFLNRGSIRGTTDAGIGGDITLNIANSLRLRNRSQISAATQSGRGGDITIQNLDSLRVFNSLISAESETGRAGRLRVHASDVVLLNGKDAQDRGGLSVGSGGYEAGNLTVTTNALDIQDEASIEVSNTGAGDAGNLTINAFDVSLNQGRIRGTTERGIGGNIQLRRLNSLYLDNGSEISASTDRGQGGNLNIDTRDGGDIRLSGSSSLEAEANELFGEAGSLEINNVDHLIVERGSDVTVSSERGEAGDLTINANFVTLDDGLLTAIAGEGDRANITLNASDGLLQLSNSSLISAEASNDATGGNVTLSVPNGFIIANPFENSDIVASAIEGNGGSVNITALQIFGLAERTENTPLSDINVSSTFGASGTLELNTLNVDPSQGIVALPENVAPPTQVDQRCATGRRTATGKRGEFLVTGRGGLPHNADEALGSDAVQVDLVTTDTAESSANSSVSFRDVDAIDGAIVEAQGWVVNANGNTVLTASASTATPHQSQYNTIECPLNH